MKVNCLTLNCRHILNKITSVVRNYHFILAGGTALALQLGHRVSVDLDFFSGTMFKTEDLFRELCGKRFDIQLQEESKGTLNVIVDGAKLSFLYYPYKFVENMVKWHGIVLASPVDIAGMKVISIIQRGAKRDFVDLYFIMQNIPFWKIANNTVNRFTKQRVNPVIFGKAIVYFNDAEADPEPEYCSKMRPAWKEVKQFFVKNVKQMVYDLQNAIVD